MDTRELIEVAMKATGDTSFRAFAKRAHVTHPTVLRWIEGTSAPDFEQAAMLAQLAGLDPVKTACDVRSHTKAGAKYRAILRQMARAAAVGAVALLPYLSTADGAQNGAEGLISQNLAILPIM